jgi:hypothetical protein
MGKMGKDPDRDGRVYREHTRIDADTEKSCDPNYGEARKNAATAF